MDLSEGAQMLSASASAADLSVPQFRWHGVPTFESVLTCSYEDGATIIADGGIKTAGDIVKVTP